MAEGGFKVPFGPSVYQPKGKTVPVTATTRMDLHVEITNTACQAFLEKLNAFMLQTAIDNKDSWFSKERNVEDRDIVRGFFKPYTILSYIKISA